MNKDEEGDSYQIPLDSEIDIDAFNEQNKRLNSGLCPNGCGDTLTENEHGNNECTDCGFLHVKSVCTVKNQTLH